MASKKSIKETKYCSLMAQTVISDDEYVYAIERIRVKRKGTEEIRFAVYLHNNNKKMMLVRPLDMEEELLAIIMDNAVKERIFSRRFVNKMRKVFVEE